MSNIAVRDEMAPALNLLGNTFKEAMEVATVLSQSDLIPIHFQKKPANIFIALQMAARQNLDPFLVMQSIYVVHGRPGFEGKFLIALANRAGWNLRFKTEENSRGEVISCQAYSEKDGIKVFGPKITWEMVQAEGWDKPKGSMASKWVTLRSLMFTYRAGAWFVNTVCPELRLGLPTTEELEDITPLSITTAEPEAPMKAPEPEAPAKLSPPQPSVQCTLDTLVAESRLNPDQVTAYVQAIVDHKKVSIDTVQAEAAKNWEKFVTTFEKWLKKQVKESPQSPPVPPEPQTNGNTPVADETGITSPLAVLEDLMLSLNVSPEAFLPDFNAKSMADLTPEQIAEVVKRLKG